MTTQQYSYFKLNKYFKIITLIIGVIIVTVLYVYYYITNDLDDTAQINKELIITIPNNTNIEKVVLIFNENNIFKPGFIYKYLFKIYSRIYSNQIFAGCYKFKQGLTNKDIMSSIFNGTNLFTINVTYPEGITLVKFAQITEKKFNISCDKFLNYANSPETLKKFGIKAKTAEGYLMPSTYEFYYNPGIETVVNRLIKTQSKLWNKKYAAKAEKIGWSRHKVLTLASIIEAETPLEDERPRVSGVYINRLKKGILLQADPTVQFAVGGKPRLLYRDLKINSPYNTYLHLGLPPGPINSPSESSIDAALNPEVNDYIYFVARGDGSNRHNFAKNIQEHSNFIALYRRNLRQFR